MQWKNEPRILIGNLQERKTEKMINILKSAQLY